MRQYTISLQALRIVNNYVHFLTFLILLVNDIHDVHLVSFFRHQFKSVIFLNSHNLALVSL